MGSSSIRAPIDLNQIAKNMKSFVGIGKVYIIYVDRFILPMVVDYLIFVGLGFEGFCKFRESVCK